VSLLPADGVSRESSRYRYLLWFNNCLWQSLLEMQALLIELVENFEFSPPPGDIDVKRGMAAIMIPMVKGQEKKGKQLFLTVTPIAGLPPDS
jgi:hypothetical protein